MRNSEQEIHLLAQEATGECSLARQRVDFGSGQ
jgi:hypothetical protein